MDKLIIDKLYERVEERGVVCLGLDTDASYIPQHILEGKSLDEIMPNYFEQHDLQTKDKYLGDRMNYLKEIKESVLEDTKDILEEIRKLSIEQSKNLEK